MEQTNYKKAVKYEYGLEGEKDYQKALSYYKLALLENPHAKTKVKYSHFSIIEAIVLVILLITGIMIDIKMLFPWFGLFLIGSGFSIVTLFFIKKYWILTGYANILNLVILFVGLVLIMPYSVIKPYLNGITWIPVVLLFTVSVFVAFSTLVLYFSDREKIFLLTSVISFIMLFGSLISFAIKTPDKLYTFKKVEDGIEITGYRSNENRIRIPEKISGYDVVSIGDQAFSEWQFEAVILNSKLKRIGRFAFRNNRALKEIKIPDGVSIGAGAFASNLGLETLKLPSDLEVIPFALCDNCPSLETIEIPKTVTEIHDFAFRGTKLTEVALPNNLLYFGNEVFGLTTIESLTFPESLVTLGRLSNMTELLTFNLPLNISTLPYNFLHGNRRIKQLIIPDQIKYIDSYAFSNTQIETITLHDEITYGEGLFYQATQLKTFDFPLSMTFIPKSMFSFSGVESIVIPSHINHIGINAFAYARQLTDLVINPGVKSIETGAFMYTEALLEVVLPETVISISRELFRNATSLKKVTLPSQLTAIPDRLFEDAYHLTTVNLSDNIKTIGKNSFKNTAITHMTLPKALEIIDDYAFFGASQLETVIFNENLKTIKTHSFGSASALKEVNLPTSLITIEDYSFNGANSLEKVYIKGNVEMVGYWAFRANETMIIYIDNNPYMALWSAFWNPLNAQVIIE